MNNRNLHSTLVSIIRWAARILSIGSIGLLMMFMFGGNEEGPSLLEAGSAGLIFFPGLIMVGMALAWWKEFEGGVLTVVGLLGFYIWHMVVSGSLPRGPYFALFALPGILFLIAWFGDKLKPEQPAISGSAKSHSTG